MPRYVIHIGPHKTATTYLQGAFRSMQPKLAAHGIHYSMTWQAGASPGHSALLRRLGTLNDNELAKEFAALNRSAWKAVLISSEALVRLKPEGVSYLKSLIGDHPVEIIYYVRPWSEVVVSAWHGEIKRGGTSLLPDRLNAHLADPRRSHLINHNRILSMYADAFGAGSLRIASYNAVLNDKLDILDHFARSFLGIDKLPEVKRERRNVSLGMVDSEILRALNVIGKQRGGVTSEPLRAGHYNRVKGELALSKTRAAIGEDMIASRARLDSAELEQYHKDLFLLYPAAIVPPLLESGRLIASKLTLPKYPSGGYAYADGVIEELRAAYAAAAAIVAKATGGKAKSVQAVEEPGDEDD